MRPLVHGPVYRKLAPLIRRAALLNPATVCWRCGRILDKCKPHRDGRPARWTAGHVNDDQPDWTLTIADLAAECSPCNYSEGAAHGNRKRIEPTSQAWR